MISLSDWWAGVGGSREARAAPIFGIMERRGPTRPKFGTVCALLSVSGMMAVFVLAGSAGSASSPAFSAIKVCANSAIWVGGCATNERNSTLRSSTLTCSFTIAANAANVTAFWRYNGVPGFTRKFAPDPRATIGSIAFDTGGEQPIPGGIYTCVVRAGTAQGSATIKSSGPMGAIVQAAACSGDHASRIGPARLFPLCPNDESARPVAGGRAGSVVCNAVYPSAVGQTATTELLRDGTPIGHTSFKVTETLTQASSSAPLTSIRPHYNPATTVADSRSAAVRQSPRVSPSSLANHPPPKQPPRSYGS